MLRWFQNQIYCNGYVKLADGFRTNDKKGITISVKKRGGWESSFKLACEMAGWPTQK